MKNKNQLVQSILVEEQELIQKTKEFLKKLARSCRSTGIVLKPAEAANHYALAYEKERFVVIVPNGEIAAAKAYGNWDEALICAKKLLLNPRQSLKTNRILLAQYDVLT